MKIGLILILIGLFVPLSILPFVVNYEPRMGLLYNIQRMQVVLWEEKRNPIFIPDVRDEIRDIFDRVAIEEQLGKAKVKDFLDILASDRSEKQLVHIYDTQYVLEFPKDMNDSEMQEVLETRFQKTTEDSEFTQTLDRELLGIKRWRFIRWEEINEIAIPYKYPLLSGMILIFVGILSLILSLEKKRKKA